MSLFCRSLRIGPVAAAVTAVAATTAFSEGNESNPLIGKRVKKIWKSQEEAEAKVAAAKLREPTARERKIQHHRALAEAAVEAAEEERKSRPPNAREEKIRASREALERWSAEQESKAESPTPRMLKVRAARDQMEERVKASQRLHGEEDEDEEVKGGETTESLATDESGSGAMDLLQLRARTSSNP